jgi:hypothetical protein
MFENLVVLFVDTTDGAPAPLLECIALPFLGFPAFFLLYGVASIAVILPPRGKDAGY